MENIVFNDFAKLDLRIGKILNVQEIENADKLLKLEVSFKEEKRIIIAGIKKHYSKENLIGKKFVFVYNLQPRKLKGIESQGMILAAVSEDESKLVLLKPEKDIEEGSKIR